MKIIKSIINVAIALFSMQIAAQEIVTDRPDQTESSVTVGKNNFQIESGILFQNSNENTVSSFFGPSTLLRYGISGGFELRVMTQYEATKIELDGGNRKYTGLNDLEIGAKIQLFKKENVNTEIAFLSHIILPTANDQVSTNDFGVINKLAISQVISDKVGIAYNVGFDHVEKQSTFTYSIAIGFGLSDNLSFYVEPYGAIGESNEFESNFDAGFTYLLNSNFQLDVSYGLGLNNDMRYISTGLSWKIPNFLQHTKS